MTSLPSADIIFRINPDDALELSIILLMHVSWVFVTHAEVTPKVN